MHYGDSSDKSDAIAGQKRKNETHWKQDVEKQKRMMGQPYIGRSNNEVVTKEPRVMGPRCQSTTCAKSSKQCSKIREEDRMKIFKSFWRNLNWEEKRMYVRDLVDITPVQRRRGSTTFVFYLKVDGERKRVCRSLFLATLGIGEWCALNWVHEAGDKESNRSSCRRGEAYEFMRCFLQDLHKVPSQFCGSSSKQYLEPVFQSMADLYEVYHRAAEERMLRPLSKQVLSEEFKQQNLGLYHLKRDQCATCCSFNAGSLPDNEWKDHLLRREGARAAKVQDRNDANEKTMVVCMDLQAVLLCPRLKTPSFYCKQKLAVHNFTIYDMSKYSTTCYVWHEGEGTLSPSEFASCITDFLSGQREHAEYILWSDGYKYQNRNLVLSNALLKFSTEMRKVVIQKFLEKGHPQMECDSVHSIIEKCVRNQEIYIPDQYVNLIRKARSKPNPYEVRYVDHTFFQDFTTLTLCKSIHPGNKPGDLTVHDVRAIRYNIDGRMDFKVLHSDNWTPFPKFPHATSDKPAVTWLYRESQKIEEIKYKHLQDLKEVLPKDFHSFYDNLNH